MSEFIIKDSPGKGKGLFAARDIEKNEVLFKFEGKKYSLEEALELPGNDRFLQIGADLFLDVGSHFSAFTNHSCNPNCYINIVVNTAFLISLIPIKTGEEIYFDYSTTSTDTPEMWSMECNCHQFYCRKNITGFQSVPDDQKRRMVSLGMVPSYVVNAK